MYRYRQDISPRKVLQIEEQFSGRLIPARGGFLQTPLDDLIQTSRTTNRNFMQRLRVVTDDGRDYFSLGVVRVWVLSRDQLIKQGAETENVTAIVQLFAAQLFG